MRRLEEELGVKTSLNFLFRFHYQASFHDVGSEHELCSVYIGKCSGTVRANRHEIAEWTYVSLDELGQDLLAHPEVYTPWFKIELKQVQHKYLSHIDRV